MCTKFLSNQGQITPINHNLQDPTIKQQELLKDHIVGDENGDQQWWNENYHSKSENSSN